jgi:hypothetical protein
MAAERAGRRQGLACLDHASMRPRPNGRGKRRALHRVRRHDHGFNEAAAKWPRKGHDYYRRMMVGKASMRPRPNGRGKFAWLGHTTRSDRCFNEAAAKWPRKARRGA